MIKLLTHTDLDGVSCAILANIVYKNQVEIEFFHNPNELNKYLENFNNIYNQVFITDLSCDKKYLNEHTNIYLFDHHKSVLDLHNGLNHIVQIEFNNHLTCGTELFYYYLKPLIKQDLAFFVELVRLYDIWEWVNNFSKLPYYLNNLLYIYGINKFIDKYSYLLEDHNVNELNLFTNQDRLLLINHDIQIDKYINDKIQNTNQQTILINNQEYTISICFASKHQSLLGEKINSDIVAIIDLNRNICSLRTNNDNIDLSLLIKKINKNGGGHKKAAGCELDNFIKDNVCQYLIDKLQSKI